MEEHLLAKIGQYGIIKNEFGQVLVLERTKSRLWTLPGGRLNKREDWKAALAREIKEEAGLDSKVVGPSGCKSNY